MQYHDVCNDKERNDISAVHASATYSDSEYDKRPMISLEFIQEQVR